MKASEQEYEPFIVPTQLATKGISAAGRWLRYRYASAGHDPSLQLNSMPTISRKNRDRTLKLVQQSEDLDFLFNAVIKNPVCLGHLEQLKLLSEELALKIVRFDCFLLRFMSDKSGESRAVVIEAINQEPLALSIISENLQNDEELVMEAVKINVTCLQLAFHTLRGSREFALKVIEQIPATIFYFEEQLTIELPLDPKVEKHVTS
jgi:hypothetical protein